MVVLGSRELAVVTLSRTLRRAFFDKLKTEEEREW
jgi:hypothetical protein